MKLKNLFTIVSLTLLISVFLSCESPTKPERDAEKDANGTNYQVPEIPLLIDPGEKTSFGKNYTVLWSTADRATRYRIQESADSSFTTILSSANTDSASTVFNHLVKSPKTYYYRVKGVNGEYESGWSNVVDMTVNPQAPSAPDKLQASALSSSRITLTWTDNSDNELRFTIERRKSQGTYAVIDTVASDATTFDDSDLAPDTKYFYRIQAYNAGGNSGYSNEADVKTRTIFTLTLEVNQSGWGTTNPSIGAHSYDEGTTVTVTATPASGYQFVSWTGSVIDTLKSSTTATVISNMTVTANFEKIPVKQYTLTMAVNQVDWGATSPAVGVRSYDEGSVVTVTATPASGYRFVSWTGSIANTNSAATTVMMNGDQTVTANFERTYIDNEIVVNIAAENIELPKINIYWTQYFGYEISHYNVYRSLSEAGLEDNSSALITSTIQEYYIDIYVEIGRTYYYKVTAVDKENKESLPSSIVSDRILPPVELIAPINYQYTGSQPIFSWKPVDGAEKYVITLTSSRIGGEIWNTEVNKNTTQIQYSCSYSLIKGNTYYWRVGTVSITEINSESSLGTFVVKSE